MRAKHEKEIQKLTDRHQKNERRLWNLLSQGETEKAASCSMNNKDI